MYGFWHAGRSQSSGRGVTPDDNVVKQFREISNTPLFTDADSYRVRVRLVTAVALANATLALLGTDDRISVERPTRMRHMMNASREYYEFPTLCELHSFCQESLQDEVVFYIHTKSQDGWRREMEDKIFAHCAPCFRDDPSKLLCGTRYIHQWGWCHFGGNFWMARCSYVRRLNLPFFRELLDEVDEAVKVAPQHNRSTNQAGWPHDLRPYGRFFAEWWVTNDIRERPAHRAKLFEYTYYDRGGQHPHYCAVSPDRVCILP